MKKLQFLKDRSPKHARTHIKLGCYLKVTLVYIGLKANICYNACRFMLSDKASHRLYIYSNGKMSLELCDAFRNASLA